MSSRSQPHLAGCLIVCTYYNVLCLAYWTMWATLFVQEEWQGPGGGLQGCDDRAPLANHWDAQVNCVQL